MKIALFGATGRMGQAITQLAKHDEILPISASSDADVAIDFSSPEALELHLSTCITHSLPLVIGTTGLGPDHRDAIDEAAQTTPIFYASNFSLGIALLKSALAHIRPSLEDAYIDIIERHASTKKDAPSGTALEIAQLFDTPTHIHSIRSTGSAFNHDVHIAYGSEELRLSHACYSRNVYAEGALHAARFLKDQPPALYSMEDLTKVNV